MSEVHSLMGSAREVKGRMKKELGIEMVPVSSEVASPSRFRQIYRDHKADIQSLTLRPARLGSGGFGEIVVAFKAPVLRRVPRSR